MSSTSNEAQMHWMGRLEEAETEVRVLREMLARADALAEAQRVAISALSGWLEAVTKEKNS
jgi:hypothetical protein